MSEMKRWPTVGALLGLLALLGAVVFGSNVAEKPEPMDAAGHPAPETPASPAISVPVDGSASRVSPTPPVLASTETWNQRSAKVGPAARQAIERFSIEYPGVLADFTPEQMAWAIRAGIPTPEQFAAAESMTIEELEVRAAAGDGIAAVFAADRRLDRLAEYVGEEGIKGLAGQTREALQTLPVAQRWMDQLNHTSCSIMAPHFELRVMRVLYGTPTRGMELAALSRVAAMGDWRAEARIRGVLAQGMGITDPAIYHELEYSLRSVGEVASRRGPGCPVPQRLPE